MTLNEIPNNLDEVQYYTITLPRRDYRILFVTDMHMADEEFRNTINYVETQEECLRRIIEGAKKKIYDVVIFLGDVFDRPYKNPNKLLYHIILFEELFTVLEGRVFKVIGNHPLNKRKNDVPTFFFTGQLKCKRVNVNSNVIQRTTKGIIANYGLINPLIYAPDRLHVNGTLINFFHYNKENKNYYDPLTDLTKKPTTHIGCYHDNIMNDAARKYIKEISTGGKFELPTIRTVENSGIFKNVDYAMIGDIHTKIGEFKVTNTTTGKTTNADIPGSIARTANHRAQQHNDVKLPLLTITEDGQVTKEHINFPLTDYRKIFKVDLQVEEKQYRDKLDDFKNAVNILKAPETFEQAINSAVLELGVRDILTTCINGNTPKIKYQDNETYKNIKK